MQYKARNLSIDAFRIYAFIAVVIIHVFQPIAGSISVEELFISLLRWAVPFYFISSGYFLGKSTAKTWAAISKLFSRLAIPMGSWLIIYSLVFHDWWALQHPKLLVLNFLSGGPAFHLWFLPALGISTAVALVTRRFGVFAMLGSATILYTVGLMFGSYRQILSLPPIPYPYHIEFKSRWGPFEGTLFVVLGYLFSTRNINLSIRNSIILVLFGILIQIGEMFLIFRNGGSFGPHDYLIGTVPFGIGMFALSRSLPSSSFTDRVGRLGAISLGAYCVHILFVHFIKYFFSYDTGWPIAPISVAVVILSLSTSWVMAQLPLVQRLVK